MENAIYRALIEECAKDLGVTLEGISKSPQRAVLREAVAKVATEKLSAALEAALPKPRFLSTQANAANHGLQVQKCSNCHVTNY